VTKYSDVLYLGRPARLPRPLIATPYASEHVGHGCAYTYSHCMMQVYATPHTELTVLLKKWKKTNCRFCLIGLSRLFRFYIIPALSSEDRRRTYVHHRDYLMSEKESNVTLTSLPCACYCRVCYEHDDD
jgi:hypothetical protein